MDIFGHQRFVGNGDAQPLNGGRDGEIHRVEVLIFVHGKARTFLFRQPQRPVCLIPCRMQERQRSQRCTRPHRAYHRGECLFEQQVACAHVRAEHDGRVVRFGFEIDVMIGGGGQGDLQIRLLTLHLQQARHQPAHGAGGRLEPDHGLLAAGLVGHGQQVFERRLQFREQGAAL